MDKYYSFNVFMNEVIEKADSLSRRRHNLGLEELYRVSDGTMEKMELLIEMGGWGIFLAVVALFALGPFLFFMSIGTFLTTPIGMIVGGILGIGAFGVLRVMYNNKILPNAVRDVGEKFKPRWENANGNRMIIDRLLEDAAENLYYKASSVNELVRGWLAINR